MVSFKPYVRSSGSKLLLFTLGAFAGYSLLTCGNVGTCWLFGNIRSGGNKYNTVTKK
jgi:hypothetical protein